MDLVQLNTNAANDYDKMDKLPVDISWVQLVLANLGNSVGEILGKLDQLVD